MTTFNIYNTSPKKISTITADKTIFSAKINSSLMALAVKVYLANQRQASAKTKSRGQVITSKKKIHRQKGTGQARHGSRNAPIFVGGAKAHGPTGEQNYKLKFPKKMKRSSLFSALTFKASQKSILVVKGLIKLEPKTKRFHQFFQALLKEPKKILLLISSQETKLKKGVSNLPYLNTTLPQNLNCYHVLNAQTLIFTPQALLDLKNHFLPSSKSAKPKK